MMIQGRIQDFNRGGGGTGETRSPFRQGSRARLRVMEALGFVCSLVLSEPYF